MVYALSCHKHSQSRTRACSTNGHSLSVGLGRLNMIISLFAHLLVRFHTSAFVENSSRMSFIFSSLHKHDLISVVEYCSFSLVTTL